MNRSAAGRLATAGGVLIAIVLPAVAAGAEPSGQGAYDRSVLPVLQRYCADCHTRDTSEGRWAFDGYAQYADLVADQKTWGKASQLVAGHLMPPREAEAPSAAERRTILEWIDRSVFAVDSNRPDPGRTTLRRLNRAEYNNSVRDILGVECRPADQFPADDAGYGFDNVGDVLSVSPLHIEKYLAAAQQVAEEVTRLAPPPRVGVELTADQVTVFAGAPELRDKLLLLRSPQDAAGTTIRVPRTGVYRILSRASVTRNSDELWDRIEVTCDDQPIAELAPAAEWKGKPGAVATAFALAELPAGEHRIALRVKTPAQESDTAAPTAAIAFLGVSGPFTPMPPQASDYLQQAAKARALGVPILRLSGEDLDAGSGRSSLDTGRAWFASNGYRRAPVLIRTAGEYRARFKVGAQQAGDEPVKFEVRLADRKLGPFAVTAASQAEQWVETKCQLPVGELDWQVWFVNEYKDPQTNAERWFWLHEFTIEGPLAGDYGLSREEAADVLEQAGRRLFRRPLASDESQKLARLLNSAIAAGQSPQEALSVGLEALLVSPKFLYHPLPKPAGGSENGAALIDELTLASRLSYFLWSSAPDEELLLLAERGKLRASLAAQVKRMLGDPKSAALTENFAGQWLALRDLDLAVPDPVAFPEFDTELAAEMRRETELLFEHILRENRSVLDFLNADYTYLSARLAQHYGLSAPAEEGFQRVSLADSPRRGVVTHASVLTITSHPTRTSPVKRGKWLLERMLGTEPPPAPRDVPPLPEERENEVLPLRKRLEQHRDNAACASCHALLDPPGFALENYDAIGRWRPTDAGRPVDPSGRLITGEQFADWPELRGLLVGERQEEFVRCLTEHILTYALGRGVTYQDKTAVRAILAQAKSSNYGFQELILAVCQSVPFQQMRAGSP
ncbi:MAG TPA: DUF1592 domain-containing protein [Pirellulaceae bacterium]|nr:DUF1592 domain-containing protein [Pirellulaceae bacterium]